MIMNWWFEKNLLPFSVLRLNHAIYSTAFWPRAEQFRSVVSFSCCVFGLDSNPGRGQPPPWPEPPSASRLGSVPLQLSLGK